jgi:hypothetical protein
MPVAVCIATLPLIFLSWIRSFKELAIFTWLGVLSLLFTIGAILYDGTFNPPVKFKDLDMIVPDTILEFIGPVTFLFTTHYCVLSMGSEVLIVESKMEAKGQSVSLEDADSSPNLMLLSPKAPNGLYITYLMF